MIKQTQALTAFLLLICATLPPVHLHAQARKEPALTIEAKIVGTEDKKALEMRATHLRPGSYSVLIAFTKKENFNESPRVLRVVKNSGNILRAHATDPKQPIIYQYRYSYINGYAPRKVDSTFIYRLPYSVNKPQPVRTSYLFNVNERYFNQSRNINWASLKFELEKGDTVFAIRKGEVVQIKDDANPMDREERVSYTSNRNSIMIEHTDGTICTYSIFEKGSFMVSEGDIVYPGTPLGICGLQNIKQEDYQIRLFVNYPVANLQWDVDDPQSPAFFHHYYMPVFATDQGDIKLESWKSYKAVSSDELIEKEMTKKEIKKHSR